VGVVFLRFLFADLLGGWVRSSGFVSFWIVW